MTKTMNLGKVAMTTAGAYDSSKSYERLTCVTHNYVSWVSRKDVPAGIAPGTSDVYWQKVSERGAQGIKGERGLQGNSAFDGTGVEIVNNLTEGGETAVLSAEQGRILKQDLATVESILDIEESSEDLTSTFTGLNYKFNETRVGEISIPEESYLGYRGTKLAVKKGDKLSITGLGGAALRLYCVVDNDNVIQEIAAQDVALTNYTILIHKDGYFYCNCNGSEEYPRSLYRLSSKSVVLEEIKVGSNLVGEVSENKLRISSLEGVLGNEEKTKDLTDTIKTLNYVFSETNIGYVSIPTEEYMGFRSTKIVVKKGDKIHFTGEGGNAVRLYCLVDNDNVIVDIAQPDIKLTNHTIYVNENGYFYYNSTPSADISIRLTFSSSEVLNGIESNFLIIDNQIEDLNKKVRNEVREDITHLLKKGMYVFSSVIEGEYTTPEFRQNGAFYCLCQEVKEGDRVTLTGTGGSAPRLYCLLDNNSKIRSIASAGESAKNLEIHINADGLLYCSFDANHEYSIERAYDRGDSLMQELEEDLTNEVSNGYYSYSSTNLGEVTTPQHNFNGGYRCIAKEVSEGDELVLTGLGGNGARLYCLVNSENQIRAIASPGEYTRGLKLKVEESGYLYCSFDVSQEFSILRRYSINRLDVLEESVRSFNDAWNKGSYEFGRTCDCNYTSPEIPRWVSPEVGEIVNYIYSCYDELVSRYPQYVSKENCDDVMARLGETKPASISHLPLYMYKFVSPRTPKLPGMSETASDVNRIKAFILTGTHPEYAAIWGCYNALKLICEQWQSDENLEELRWNSDIYIIPCFNPYGVDNRLRTNENGVNLNRNAPTADWKLQGENTTEYTGPYGGSEYSVKALMHYLQEIKPQIFIDHHNTTVGSGDDEGDGKNLIYTHCVKQIGLDVAGTLISQMTRKWKMRFTDTFPSIDADPNTLYGFTSFDEIVGSLGKYATECGALGSTYECNRGTLYKNGEYSTANRDQFSPTVMTCATEGLINYLVRMLKAYSEMIGVK